MNRVPMLLTVLAGTVLAVGCADPVRPEAEAPDALLSTEPASCWGQATKVFARMGEMGQHAAEQPTPRLGLKNLAEALFEAGVIAEPTLQALGAFVAAELGLSIEACM